VSPYGDLVQRKTEYWRTNEGKNLKKIANPQAFSVEQFVFSYFSLKFSHYTVLEAKCVENWKSEILWWAHYLVRNKKIIKLCVYRPCSLDMRRACASQAPPRPAPPARPPTPCPARPPLQHVAETRYRDSSGPPVRNRSPGGWGGGGRESHAHAPRFPYRLGINGTVWGFGLTLTRLLPHISQCVGGQYFGSRQILDWPLTVKSHVCMVPQPWFKEPFQL
jgi:hypothetical protein